MFHEPYGSPITRIPKEIHTEILLTANHVDKFIEESSFNCYTKQAKCLRQVCQLWRSIIDLTSNYTFRITYAYFNAHHFFPPEESCGELEEFYRRLDSTKSLLAVRMRLTLDDNSETEIGTEQKSIGLAIIKRLLSVQSRLYRIDGEFADLEVISSLFSTIDLMRNNSPLSFVSPIIPLRRRPIRIRYQLFYKATTISNQPNAISNKWLKKLEFSPGITSSMSLNCGQLY